MISLGVEDLVEPTGLEISVVRLDIKRLYKAGYLGFAATLYNEGVPDEVVGDLLGHTPSVTRRYAPGDGQAPGASGS